MPNPVAFAAVKAAAYTLFGGLVSLRNTRPGSRLGGALAFGTLRTIGGWAVGVPFALAVWGALGEMKDSTLIAALALPRLALSAMIIRWLFRPRGGWWEATLWAVANVALTSAVDWWLYANYRNFEWLWMTWC